MPLVPNELISSVEYAQLNGLPLDTNTWTRTQINNYHKWTQPASPFETAPAASPFDEAASPFDIIGSDNVDTVSSVTSDWDGRRSVDSILDAYDNPFDNNNQFDTSTEATGTIIPEFSEPIPISEMAPTEATGTIIPEFSEPIPISEMAPTEATGTIIPEFGEPIRPISEIAPTEATGTIIPEFGEGPIDTSSIPQTRASSIAPDFNYEADGKMSEIPADVLTRASSRAPTVTSELAPRPPKFRDAPLWRGNEVQNFDSLPEFIDIPKNVITDMGVTPMQAADMLEGGFMGLDSMGNPMFDLEAIARGVGKGLLMQAALAPLLGWMNTLGPVGQTIVTGINLLGMANMVWSMDPFAAGVNILMAAGNAYKDQLQREHDNDYNEDVADSRLMMVKDAGVWYPAILKNRSKGEGWFDQSNQIEVAYGRSQDLVFTYESGMYRGHFKNQKNRMFRMEDDQWSGDKSTKDFTINQDPLRQYYFLSNDDQQKIMSTYGTDQFQWDIEDEHQYDNSFLSNMMDMQSALDIIQNSERKTKDSSTFLTSRSKGIRRTFTRQYNDNIGAFKTETIQHSTAFPKSGDKWGVDSYWDSYVRPGKWGLEFMHKDFDMEILPNQLRSLETTRGLAAKSVGVDPRLYLDNAKKMPYAYNARELREQFNTIDRYSDRSDIQKTYLKQKASARYMFQFANDIGYSADVYDVLQEKSGDVTSKVTKQGILDYRPSLASFGHRGVGGGGVATLINIPTFGLVSQGPSSMQSIPAWTNKDENAFPGFLHLADWQRNEENYYASARDTDINTWTGDGHDADEIIKFAGLQFEQNNPDQIIPPSLTERKPKEPTPQIQKIPPKPIPEGFWGDEWLLNRRKPMAREKFAPSPFLQLTDYKSGPLEGHKITFDNFKQMMNNPEFKPEDLGEHSILHVIDNFVNGMYTWTKPADLTLTSEIVPPSMIRGKEEIFKPLLEHIDQSDPQVKERAAYLHDYVFTPMTEAYQQKFHPNDKWSDTKKYAHDAKGHLELFDDWEHSLRHQDVVIGTDGTEHHQMDFGFTDDI